MSRRSDIHSPKHAISADYRYLASSFGYKEEDLIEGGEVTVIEWEGTDEWKALGEPEESTAAHAVKGKCDHCGAAHKYQTILLHVPSGDIISVGHTCATYRFERPEFGKQIAAAARKIELEHAANVKETAAIRAMDEITVSAFNWAKSDVCCNKIAKDIASKARKYGPLTERQSAFLVRLYATHLDTQEKLETGQIEECPNGRIEVTGEVLSIKREVDEFKSNRWGNVYRFKILVRSDKGFKVYGTCPVQLLGDANDCCYMECVEPPLKKGDRVSFVATVEQSKKDRAFGVFSRPSKSRLIEPSQETA